jgi:beta-1,4-mannosyl-glycoprotein beta-1,4-N-acetylglucosaminyltransferase
MPTIFDCFIFNNELDLLELRLNELSDVVDYFVLAEATVSFRGLPKPLVFEQHKDRFALFLDRIIHIVVDDMPGSGSAESERWKRENFQRQALIRGLSSASWRDYVIVSDVDEIPRPGAIEEVARKGLLIPTRYAFEMRAFWYYLNLEGPGLWTFSAMALRANLIDVNQFRLFGPGRWITPRHQPKRLAKTIKYFGTPMRWINIPNGGWHFTFMNGPEAVREKLFHYSHACPDGENTLANAKAWIEQALQQSDYQIRALDGGFPTYLRKNASRYEHMLLPADPKDPDRLHIG